jgi:2-keto-3-deoxy-L-rhamnonate aldolase RhmA
LNRLQTALQKSGGRTILGAACYTYTPEFLEMAHHMGYTAAWIEMEHTFLTFAQAADLCRMASAWGMLTMIRIPDAGRETILKAAECGPDILDLPMANTPEMLEALVTNARFPPVGARGFFGVSRAVDFGIPELPAQRQQKLNDELCLMIQIETAEAVERIEELCRVPGIDAIFMGPADLSASLGVPGQTGHPKVFAAAEHCISIARSHGKQVAVACAPADFPFWASQRVDLLYAANDLTAMKTGALQALEAARAACAQASGASRS